MNAIIGGTGIDRILSGSELRTVKTKYGDVDYYALDGLAVIAKHKADHSLAPSRINYKANIQALCDLGVENVIGIYAVGSITSRLSPGSFGIVEDFLDFSGRSLSFCDGVDGPLRHTGMVRCFDKRIMTDFAKTLYKAGEKEIKSGIVYVTTSGPRFETPAEIRAFRNLGADVVGMTLGTEASLIREKGLGYCALAYSINWAAGLDEEGLSFLEDESVERLGRKLLSFCIDTLSAR